MNEMSIFDFFGGAPESKDSLVKPLPKKEPAKGKVKVKEKAKDNPAKGVKFALPVTVIGRSFREVMEGEGEKNLQEIAEWLHEKGYEEVRHERIGFARLSESLVTLTYESLRRSAEDELVEGNAVICEGLLKAEFTPKGDGEDAQHSVRELMELGLPGEEWRGCGLDFDQTSGVAMPVGKSERIGTDAERKDSDVWYQGERYQVKAGENVIEKVVGELPEGAECATLTSIGGVRLLTLTPKVAARCPKTDRDAFGVDDKKTVKKVQERMRLPLTVRFVNFARDYSLSEADFGGKAVVTWQDLLDCLKKREPIFAQSDRKVDHLYDEEAGCVSVAVISGSKGALFEHPCYAAGFAMKERIPRSVLNEIVTRFSRDLTKEAIAFVWRRGGRYEAVWPAEEEAGATSVRYEMPILADGDYVMTIHSHCLMRPFFSRVDDADELSMPGLYGVIGRIRREGDEISYESLFRAVYAPWECLPVSEDELFEEEERNEK